MSSIRLKTKYIDKKLDTGTSKLFGTPDIFEGFVWPTILVNDEEYKLTFIGQINLKEVNKYDKEGLLPKTGMLYFFYDLDEMPFDPNDLNACKVIYHESDINLKPITNFDENCLFKEIALKFKKVKNGFLSKNEETHLLLGTPSLEFELFSEFEDEWQMLFQLDSIENDEFCINFSGDGMLYFYIEKEKLKNRDFSNVRIIQINS